MPAAEISPARATSVLWSSLPQPFQLPFAARKSSSMAYSCIAATIIEDPLGRAVMEAWE